MTEIEQLQADIAKAEEIVLRFYKQDRQALGIGEMYDRLAKLEAEAAAKADPWKTAKNAVASWEDFLRSTDSVDTTWMTVTTHTACEMACYVRHLEQRVAELEKQLASKKQEVEDEASINNALSSDLDHFGKRIAELKAELAKRPVVYCMKNNLTGIYGQHFGLDRIALFDIEIPEVLFGWQSEPYTGEQS